VSKLAFGLKVNYFKSFLMTRVMNSIISQFQSAFVKGRNLVVVNAMVDMVSKFKQC